MIHTILVALVKQYISDVLWTFLFGSSLRHLDWVIFETSLFNNVESNAFSHVWSVPTRIRWGTRNVRHSPFFSFFPIFRPLASGFFCHHIYILALIKRPSPTFPPQHDVLFPRTRTTTHIHKQYVDYVQPQKGRISRRYPWRQNSGRRRCSRASTTRVPTSRQCGRYSLTCLALVFRVLFFFYSFPFSSYFVTFQLVRPRRRGGAWYWRGRERRSVVSRIKDHHRKTLEAYSYAYLFNHNRGGVLRHTEPH